MTITALSPSRIARAVLSATLPLCSVRVSIGPVSVAFAHVTAFGIIAISGTPAEPVQPHIVIGFGASVTNELTGTVAPLPGNTIGFGGRGALLSSPRSTSRVAAECHGVGVSLET